MQQRRSRLIIVLAIAIFGALADVGYVGAQVKASSEPAPEKAKQELLDLENHWLQVEDDPEALESILAPDFLHVLSVGIITRDDQLNYMRKHPAPHSQASKHFEDMHVRIYGSVGVVNGVVVKTDAGITRRFFFTDVFAWRDGKWMAVNAQELHPPETGH
jgi:hypothetical protein